MPLQPKDAYSQAAEMAASWLDETATKLADMLRSDGHAPFAAPVKSADKLHYYDSVFFNPDGSPNEQGRQAEMLRLGPMIYGSTLAQVMRARQERIGNGPKLGENAEGGMDNGAISG